MARRATTRKAAPKTAIPVDRTIRASSLPRGSVCVASTAMAEEAEQLGFVPKRIGNDAAQLGTAYHSVMEALIRREKPDIRQIAIDHGVIYTALEALLPTAQQMVESVHAWQDMLAVAPEVEFSVPLKEGLVLTGHADVVIYAKSSVIVLDWKTGTYMLGESPGDSLQLLAYACMAVRDKMDLYVEVPPVQLVLAYPSAAARFSLLTGSELIAAWNTIRRVAIEMDQQRDLPRMDRTYRTGDACNWCAGKVICPAYTRDQKTALAMGELHPSTLYHHVVELVKSDPATAFRMKEIAGKLYGSLKEAISGAVEFWGSLPLDPGYEARAVTSMREETLNVEHVKAGAQLAGIAGEQLAVLLASVSNRSKQPSISVRRTKVREVIDV